MDEVTQPDHESSNSIHALFLVAAPLAKDETGVSEGTRYRSHVCKLEAWVCSACGFVEWYGKETSELRLLSQHYDGRVRVVRAKDEDAYR